MKGNITKVLTPILIFVLSMLCAWQYAGATMHMLPCVYLLDPDLAPLRAMYTQLSRHPQKQPKNTYSLLKFLYKIASKHSHPFVRSIAIQTLGLIHDKNALSKLILLFSSPYQQDRCLALTLVAKRGDGKLLGNYMKDLKKAPYTPHWTMLGRLIMECELIYTKKS